MSFYYLATPYTKFPGGIHAAFEEAARQTALLVRAGVPVYSPIAHTHPVAIQGQIDPLDHSIWMEADRTFMEAAKGIIVCKMTGWETSYGVGVEIDAFQKMGKPVIAMEPGIVPPELLQSQPAETKATEDKCVQYATGAVRSADREGVRYDLITPIGLRRLAETCHEGAVKYSDYNWEKGMPIADLLTHAIAHLYAYLSGDRSEDHLAHAGWNCLGACHSEEMWPELNKNLRGPGCAPPATPSSP